MVSNRMSEAFQRLLIGHRRLDPFVVTLLISTDGPKSSATTFHRKRRPPNSSRGDEGSAQNLRSNQSHVPIFFIPRKAANERTLRSRSFTFSRPNSKEPIRSRTFTGLAAASPRSTAQRRCHFEPRQQQHLRAKRPSQAIQAPPQTRQSDRKSVPRVTGPSTTAYLPGGEIHAGAAPIRCESPSRTPSRTITTMIESEPLARPCRMRPRARRRDRIHWMSKGAIICAATARRARSCAATALQNREDQRAANCL